MRDALVFIGCVFGGSTLVAVLVTALVALIPFDKYCYDSWPSYETKYSISLGCQVKINDAWVPASRIAVVPE